MDVITFSTNLYTTSGLLILLHGFISLPDMMSYDKLVSSIRYNLPCAYSEDLNQSDQSLCFPPEETGPEVIKLYSCSTQLSMKFILLINVKMPTI